MKARLQVIDKDCVMMKDQGMVATKEGKIEGKEEAEETHGDDAHASPGALADKPMGDKPPPVNEQLSNEPAPTFNASFLLSSPLTLLL